MNGDFDGFSCVSDLDLAGFYLVICPLQKSAFEYGSCFSLMFKNKIFYGHLT